jgi:hypothetical protein
MYRIISSLAIALGLMLLLPETADARRCKSPSVRAAYQRAQAVVVAKAISIENQADDAQVALLSVSEAWKQDMPAQLKVVAGGKVCGHFFEENQEYVLYLFVNGNNEYTTSNCVGNKFINNPKLPPQNAVAAKKAIAWLRKYGRRER